MQKSQKYNGDPDLIEWLNKQLKILPPIMNIELQFQNGYLFQEVLLKAGHPLPPKIFLQNKFEEAAIKRNFQFVEQLVLKIHGMKPQVQKGESLIEELLRLIKQHRQAIQSNKKCISNLQMVDQKIAQKGEMVQLLVKTLQIKDKYQVQSLQFNYEDEFVKSLPNKLQKIEKNLNRFRDEKLSHEIKAMKLKQLEEEKERLWLQQLREVEVEKIHANHEFIKEQDKRIYQFWYNTEKIKNDRITKDKNFNEKMTQRIFTKIDQDKEAEKAEISDNITYFVASCIRQGVELKHDPERKQPYSEKAKFSAVATMMKIRDRTRKNEEARRAREKRRNKMLVDQQKQQTEVEMKKQEEELIQRYVTEGMRSNQEGRRIQVNLLRESAYTKERLRVEGVRFTQMEQRFQEMQVLSKGREIELLPERKRIWRENQLMYMQINLENKVRKRNKHQQQMQPIIQSLFDITEQCYHQQINTGQITIEAKFWRELINKWLVTHIEEPITYASSFKDSQGLQFEQHSQEFFQYYCGGGDWRPTHFYMNEEKSIFNRPFVNQDLGDLLFGIVDKIYPPIPPKTIPADLPTYMPLRLSIIGGRASGRKTITNLLAQKYGLEVFNLELMIKEAINFAAPPTEDPNIKNKKKDTKKPQEEVVVKENPEMKALGQEILPYKEKGEPIPDQLLIQIILLKIKQTFPQKTQNELELDIREAYLHEQERLKQIQSQEIKVVEKKPTILSKKAGKAQLQTTLQSVESEAVMSAQDQINKFIGTKSFFYTKGWVLIGFPENLNQAKQLEEALSGYVPEEERLNQEAENIKKRIGELVSPAPPTETNSLISSGIDLVINLDLHAEERARRCSLKRIDPMTEIYYHLEENLPPTDVKGLQERLQIIHDPLDSLENLTKEHNTINQNIPELQQWCSQFGVSIQQGEEINQLLQLQIVDGIGKSFEVAQKVNQFIEQIINSKKHTYNALLNLDAESQLNFKNVDSVIQTIQTIESKETLIKNEMNKKSEASPLTSAIPLFNVVPSIPQISTPRFYLHESIKKQHCETLLKQWREIQISYSKEIAQNLKKINGHRKRFIQKASDTQIQFLEQFEKTQEDDKQQIWTKLQNYQDSLCKFTEENPDLARQKNAQAELQVRLEKIQEEIWDSLESKKDLGVKFLDEFKSNCFAEQEMKGYISILNSFFQTEANLLSEVCELVINAKLSLKGIKIPELGQHYILEPFEQTVNIPVYDMTNLNSFPQVDHMFQYFIDQLEIICRTIIENKEKNKRNSMRNLSAVSNQSDDTHMADEIVNQILNAQKTISVYRAHALRSQTISRMKELWVTQQLIINRLNDWIIFGLKRDNSYAYEWFQYLKQCVQTRTIPNFSKPPPREISESFKPVLSYALLNRVMLPFYELDQTSDRFALQTWYQWSEELRSISDDRGGIATKNFEDYIRRVKQNRQSYPGLPNWILDIDQTEFSERVSQKFPYVFNIGSNQSNSKQTGGIGIHLQPLLICTLLLESSLPFSQEVQNYITELKEARGEDLEEFCEVAAWFDESEAAMPLTDQDLQVDRVFFVKRFLYNILKSSDQTLNLNQLQQMLQIFQVQEISDKNFKDFLLE